MSLPNLLAANSRFRLLWLGHLVSAFGDRLTHMGLLSYVLVESFDDGSTMAIITFFSLLPFLILGPLFGAWADRASRTKLMIMGDVGRALIVGFIPLLWAISQSFVLLIVLVFLCGIFSALFAPAKQSLVPAIVPKEQLIEANSLLVTTGMLATLLGTLLAGLLIKVVGLKIGFVLNAVTYAVSALLISQMRVPEAKANVGMTQGYGQLKADIYAGFQFLQKHLLVFRLIQLSSVLAFVQATAYILVINYATTWLNLEALGVGVILSSAGLGMIAGAWWLNRRKAKVNFHRALWGGLVLAGIFIYLFHHGPNVLLSVLLMVGAGAGIALVEIALDSMLQRLIPDAFKGKVFGFKGVLNNSVFLVALLLIAKLIKVFEVTGLFTFLGILTIASGTVVYLSHQEWPYKLARQVLKILLSLLFNLKVSGLEHLPRGQKVILAANHSSILDAAALLCAYPRRVYFMAADFLFKKKFSGLVMHVFGCIPVKRGGFNKESIKEALRILGTGHSLGIFPEGKITEDGRITEGKKGVAVMAKMAHVKIIPVAIEGAFEAWHVPKKKIRRFPIEVRFGKPISEAHYDSPEELTEEVMNEIADVKQQIETEGYMRVHPNEIVRHLINFG